MLSFLPSANFSWYRSNEHDHEATSTGSKSFKWRSKSFKLKDKPLDRNESYDDFQKENIGCQKENGGRQNHNHVSFHLENTTPGSGGSNSSGSDIFEDVFTPHSFENSVPSFVDDSIFLSRDLYQFFEASLPNIVKGCQWVLLYR